MYAVYLGDVFAGTYEDGVWESKVYADREDRVIIRNTPPDLLSQVMASNFELTLADVVEGQGGWGIVNTDEANALLKRAQAWLAEDTALTQIGLNDPAARAEVVNFAQTVVAIRNAPPGDGYADFPPLPAVLA